MWQDYKEVAVAFLLGGAFISVSLFCFLLAAGSLEVSACCLGAAVAFAILSFLPQLM